MKTVFITGATGYIGKQLTKLLLQRGHKVIALVRKGSEHKVITGAEVVIADPFDPNSFQSFIPKEAVFVQLLGVAHPSPKKARQFKEIDLRSVRASVDAAAIAEVSHFIYISVAMAPSKIMAAYQSVRKEGEEYSKRQKNELQFYQALVCNGSGSLLACFIIAVYGIAELVPAWRKKARAMALVTIHQMLRTLIKVVEADPVPLRIIEVKQIRSSVFE